ncbi:hypothetical protein [Streptomyces sp. NPDC001635]
MGTGLPPPTPAGSDAGADDLDGVQHAEAASPYGLTGRLFGMNYLDVNKASALLCVQLYSFDVSGESRPIFALTLADAPWFETFREQAERLWDVSQPARFPQP